MSEDNDSTLTSRSEEDADLNGLGSDAAEGFPANEEISDSLSEGVLEEDGPDRFRRLLAEGGEALTKALPSESEASSDAIDPTITLEDTELEEMPPETPVSPSEIETDPQISADRATLPYPTPPSTRRPAEDEEVILPQRVPERDVGATQVGPSAYSPSEPHEPAHPSERSSFADWFGGCGGCLLRMAIIGMFLTVALVVTAFTFGLYQYYTLNAGLPSVENLRENAAQFETTRILDREGNLLYEILDPQAGRRTYVPIEDISPYLIAAVIATEDSQFYSNPGFDTLAIIRAIIQNYQQGEIVSGASTITQQIARNLLFSAEERSQRTARRKTREVLVAAEITEQYSKDEILELYLNQIYFGNLAYGVEAAAETYFDTTADKLTLAQASFLAGLIQAPSVYDVFTNREVTLSRQHQVLSLMMQTSSEQGCIYVSNSQQPICVGPEDAGRAAAELTNFEFKSPNIFMRFPHWVNYIYAELESTYDPQTIYRSGFTVFTTLDPALQEIANEIVLDQVKTLVDHRASNGALVAIKPNTGEILAMVGSADFYNEEIDGQVNMAVQPRQPGSSIKPLTYTAAFEMGWTPGTLIWDVPSEFPPSGNPDDPRPPYEPVNYDNRFHGPVTVRSALANSYNVPAVKTLDFVGIYDDPTIEQEDGLVSFAQRMGITTLTRDVYGLSLTLGGGDVTLLELTGAYAIFANSGVRIPPVGILRIEDHTGEIVYEYEKPLGETVIRPEHAHLITSILSDNAARTPAFGPNSLLRLPFPAAAKTGTTNEFIDNWTLGYTPDVAIGVWIGNADYTPMVNTSGLTGAAPIWNEVMQVAVEHLNGGRTTPFTRPPGIVDVVICSISGTEPSEWCHSHKTEIFAFDQPPLTKEHDLFRKVWVDSYSLLLASAECPDFAIRKLGISVSDPWGRKWLEDTSQGKAWLEDIDIDAEDVFFIPEEACSESSPRPIMEISRPRSNGTVRRNPQPIDGLAGATADFRNWVLHYGIGFNPVSWTRIELSERSQNETGRLASWRIRRVPNGPITLRLRVFSTKGGRAEIHHHLTLQIPSPTPTSTASMTPTTTSTSTEVTTSTLLPSITPSMTDTPSATSTPTASETPSDSPTPTATFTPSNTPTPSATPTPSPTEPTPTS
jgi:penicillin-binding protein 1C